MRTPIQVGENLKSCFGEDIKDHDCFGDWCELGSFLSDPTQVLPVMAELDLAMYTRLFDKRLPQVFDRVNDRAMITKAYGDYYKAHTPGASTQVELKPDIQLNKLAAGHLLSEELTAFEGQHGFKFESGDFQATIDLSDRTTPKKLGERVATYHGFVQPKAFNQQLVKRSHWKDPGAQEIHGEFTHRIQWYAITRQLFPKEEKAMKVFEAIGKYPEAWTRPSNRGKLYLWDALCDRTNGVDVSFNDELFKTEDAGKRGTDFRSPENLNDYLVTNEGWMDHRWPMLRDFLAARYNKRMDGVRQSVLDAKAYPVAQGSPELAFQLQYLARKIYNESFWVLNQRTDPKAAKILLLADREKSDQILKL